MRPELFRIGDFPISTFGPMLVLAFLAAYFQLRSALRKLDAGDEEDAASIVLTAGAFGILGSKLYYAILHRDWHLIFDRAGLVWYGGFFLAMIALIIVVRRRQMPAWRTADAMTISLAIGYGIGRIGCLLVGDDYGVPTDLPWAVEFPEGAPPSTAAILREQFGVAVPPSIPGSEVLAVHPTPAYETLAALVIWGVGLWLLSRRPNPGVIASTVVGLLAVERFLVEFLRAKDDRFFDPLTLAQAISILLFVASVALLLQRLKKGRSEAAG